jgi:hypothetical protein
MTTFATANVYGEVREEVDLPFIKKTGDTCTGLIIFDGGLQTNIGTSTFNGPIIATDQITFRPEANLYCNCPSEFADDVTVTGGSFVVDVPATFNDTVICNDGITFNDIVTCTDQVSLTGTSSLTVAGTSSWVAGSSLTVDCIPQFNSQIIVGADPNLNQAMTGVSLITQDVLNGKVSSKTADQINLSDQVASVVSQSLSLTSAFLNIDNFNTGAESALTNDGVYFSNNTTPNAGSKLDLLECRVTSTPLTYANMSVVSGTPVISTYFNDGLGTNNQQSNMSYTGFGTQDNLYTTGAAMNSGGFISATCRSNLYTQPMLQLKNNLLSATGVFMEAYKEKPSAGVAGDEIFRLSMTGKNSANTKEEYGRITCNIRDPSGPAAGADGQLLFAVPVGDTMTTFIDLNGNGNRVSIFRNLHLEGSTTYLNFSDSTVQASAGVSFNDVLISQRIPYLFNMGSTTMAPVFSFSPTGSSFACSLINNLFAYSEGNGLFVYQNPAKPVPNTSSGVLLVYFTPRNFYSTQLSGNGMFGLVCNDSLGTSTSGEAYAYRGNVAASQIYMITPPNNNILPSSQAWWDSALSYTGQYQIIGSITGNRGVYVSSNFGDAFTQRGSVGVYTSVAVSSDGSTMVALNNNVSINVSRDFGVTWTSVAIVQDWANVCMSANGRYILAIPGFNAGTGTCFVSQNYGATFTSTGISASTLQNCTMSNDGMVMIIFLSTSACFKSVNYGSTWFSTASTVALSQLRLGVSGTKAKLVQNDKYLFGLSVTGNIPLYSQMGTNW